MNLLFCLLLTLIPIESLPDEVADVLYTYVDDRDIMSVGTTGLGPGRTYTVTLYDRSEWVFDELADICVVDLRRNDVPQEIIPEDLLAPFLSASAYSLLCSFTDGIRDTLCQYSRPHLRPRIPPHRRTPWRTIIENRGYCKNSNSKICISPIFFVPLPTQT